jgi:cytochrome c553/outer membrane murein-binding lipoprotein Lpp
MNNFIQTKAKGKIMKTKKIQYMIKAAALTIFLFAGCSDNGSKSDETNTTASQKIEIVANENAKEIKVAEKESDQNQSKSYYYDYNIKGEDDSKPKPRSTLDANVNVRSPYEKVEISMLVKKLSKEFIVKCSACHNDYANGIIGPSLLGKDADYIFEKISKFKDGSLKNVLMRDLVTQMSETEIRKLAKEIYDFNKRIEEMRK